MTPHPWNADLWQRLTARGDRLAHALLLAGPAGVGKDAFAMALAQFLLCEAPAGASACGQCQNCMLYQAGTHPDLHVIQPEAVTLAQADLAAQYGRRYLPIRRGETKKYSAEIRVDQVRALIDAQQTHAHIARRKIIILSPADRLNVNAANSLLKLLEEPAADTILMLVSANPARLVPTIRSRCNRINFAIPPREAGRKWLAAHDPKTEEMELLLELAGGAPLTVVAWSDRGFLDQRRELMMDVVGLAEGTREPVECASRWTAGGVVENLNWFQGWLVDLIRIQMSDKAPELFNPDAHETLLSLQKRLKSKWLYTLLDAVSEAKRRSGGQLDEALVAEDILIRWTNLVQPSRAQSGN